MHATHPLRTLPRRLVQHCVQLLPLVAAVRLPFFFFRDNSNRGGEQDTMNYHPDLVLPPCRPSGENRALDPQPTRNDGAVLRRILRLYARALHLDSPPARQSSSPPPQRRLLICHFFFFYLEPRHGHGAKSYLPRQRPRCQISSVAQAKTCFSPEGPGCPLLPTEMRRSPCRDRRRFLGA